MAVFEVPGSKSITARALFLAAAARGTTVLNKPLDSDDTAGFAEGLTALGYRLDRRRREISQNATSATMPAAPMSSVCQRWLLGRASA